MTTAVSEIFRKASELDERDRATLAGLLIESLEPGIDAEAETAWNTEIERRLNEIDSNSVTLVSWEEVMARLKRSLGA